MPRSPKPWYWEARQAWYCQLNGKQIRLHENKRLAEKEFYRLMAAEGKPTGQPGRLTFADAVETLLGQVQHLRPSTRRLYLDMLGPVAAKFKNRQLDSIQPHELISFVASYQGTGYSNKTFGDSTRSLMFRYIKTLYRWARDMGLLHINPLVRTENPWKVKSRDRVMSATEYLQVMEDRRLNDRFKEVVEIIWQTGMRPGEIAAMSARHLDANLPIARFQPTEHKTGTKTGLQREVYFPPDLWARMKKYAELRPQGPLLRNARGQPWTQELISDCFGRVKRRLGLDCVLYQARHAFFTRLVDSGVPLARAAKIGGHESTGTLMRHYYNPAAEAMAGDVAAINTEEEARWAAIKEKVAAERKKHRSVFTRGTSPSGDAGTQPEPIRTIPGTPADPTPES